MTRIVTPIGVAYPTRRPYVRDTTFIDGLPGPPFAFFDEVQDHLAARLHAALGWRWSLSREDFDRDSYPTGFLGVLKILANQTAPAGLRLQALSGTSTPALTWPGEAGVWSALCGSSPGNQFDCQLQDVAARSTGDYLVSAKVLLVGVSRLDPYTDEGFHLGVTPKTPGGPAFVAGGKSGTWWTYCGSRVPKLQDTGIACQEGRYYCLQISRQAGAVRWFINGYPVISADGTQGFYAPGPASVGRYLRIKRWNAGPSGDGFQIDYFHRLVQRE